MVVEGLAGAVSAPCDAEVLDMTGRLLAWGESTTVTDVWQGTFITYSGAPPSFDKLKTDVVD
jgi:hypothetical protein